MIPPLEAIELAGHRSLHAAAGGESVATEIGGALCEIVLPLRHVPMVNRVTALGLARPATREDVARIVGFFRAENVGFGVGLHPEARPPELPSWLEEHGVPRGYSWMKFSRGVADPPPVETDLRLVEVGREAAGAFGGVVCEGYGMPDAARVWISGIVGASGWHCYVAYDGDEPAAAGALFVEGELGWLGFAATRPAFRGRGGQSAILGERIRRAAALGVRTLATETGERVPGRADASYRNILRAGFEESYLRPNYVAATADASA